MMKDTSMLVMAIRWKLAIRTFRLLLRTGFYLDLIETHVVPSLRRNLVSVPVLDTSGYCCSFGNGKVILYQNSNLVRSTSGYCHSLHIWKSWKSHLEKSFFTHLVIVFYQSCFEFNC